jgi:cytochrome subunit of sulfide dehydrogenase
VGVSRMLSRLCLGPPKFVAMANVCSIGFDDLRVNTNSCVLITFKYKHILILQNQMETTMTIRADFSRHLLCAMTVFAGSVANASAQDAQSLYTNGLAATCASCHGTNGRAHEGSAVPSLSGMPRDYMVAQMKAFASGQRSATIMHQLAKGFSDQQIEQIAAHFAAQKK